MSVSTQTNHGQVAHIDPERMDLIKRTICRGATNDEIDLFMHACKRTELDPLMRQIYFVKMGGQMTIQTGIDGYRLIADRSGKYMPGRESTFTYDGGKLFSATSYVKKLGPDKQWHEIAATAIFSEYKGRGPLWDSKPHIMLAKCSEALALRKAFPADLSGLYTKEEMEREEIEAESTQMDQVKHFGSIGPSYISQTDAEKIEAMIHPDDVEYRKNLLTYFQADRFDKIDQSKYSAILKSVTRRSQEKMKSEMSLTSVEVAEIVSE